MDIVRIGTITSVDAMPDNDQKNAGVTAAPTATPKMVRIPLLSGLKANKFAPNSAANNDEKIGPNNHGNGKASIKNTPAPPRAIRCENMNLRNITISL